MISVDICLPRKNFDIKIKEDFNGGITGIYGSSGSGKTSLFQTIAGLVTPESGRVVINYKSVFDSERKINNTVAERRIGYVFQEGRLFPHLNVEKNLLYGFKKNEENKVSFAEVIDLLNLGHLLKSKPAQISGGERQRTALGRALLSSPSVLLLDEPFSAVDAQLRNQILPFIYKIHQHIKIPILVVSHELTDLLKLTQRLFIIRDGKCLGHGEYTDLLRVPALREIIGSNVSVNTLEMEVEDVDAVRGMVQLGHANMSQKVKAIYDSVNSKCSPGNLVKLFIRSDDVTLSLANLEGVSVHNQLKGEVKEIIRGKHIDICVVDIGVPFVVEVTGESVKRLNLEVGSDVWCLFKSVAVDMVI